MCIVDFDECHCECHDTGPLALGAVHCIPCCETCSECGKRIRGGLILHEKHCKDTMPHLTEDERQLFSNT